MSQITTLFHLTNPSKPTETAVKMGDDKKNKKGKKNKNKNNATDDCDSDESDADSNGNNNANSNNEETHRTAEKHENTDSKEENNANRNNNNNNKNNNKNNNNNNNNNSNKEEDSNTTNPNNTNTNNTCTTNNLDTFDFNNKLFKLLPNWKPWNHIYTSSSSSALERRSKGKKGTSRLTSSEATASQTDDPSNNTPSLNPYGKYVVKLYWLVSGRPLVQCFQQVARS